ncbi:MAG: DUF5615 family PIN-like protein [Bryobacterales bacterium]|nr:DUF5615 family PIN-like protein [Bryobacterales bacterium]
MRFLADADFNNAIVRGCRPREPAIDFLSANDANLAGVPDPGVLAIAAGQERILISHDFRTMPHHFAGFLQAHGSSPGLILVPQHLSIGEAVEDLLLIWGASEAGEWKNQFEILPL